MSAAAPFFFSENMRAFVHLFHSTIFFSTIETITEKKKTHQIPSWVKGFFFISCTPPITSLKFRL